MSDEEMVRNAGLILIETTIGKEGITLAAILLFGSDNLIVSTLSHHKSDAIFLIFNVDHYDDRDIIITTLLDSYDRWIAFNKKHLEYLFVMQGLQRISVRDKILREIVSNLLIHRDYANAYVTKLAIEKNRLFTENSNRPHSSGKLNLATFIMKWVAGLISNPSLLFI